MSRLIKIGKVSTKGGFNLFWGAALSSVISAIGIMIVAGILEESQYGLYTIALITPNFIQIIRDFGIDQATIKYVAQYNQENQPQKIKKILIAGITAEFISGLFLATISFILSGYIASEIFNRPEISPYIQIASFTIFGSALTKIADSTFIGYEKMQYRSTTLVIQSVFKTILMISLVALNFGVYGAVIGHTLAFLITGIIAITILYFKIYKRIKTTNHEHEIIKTLKEMSKYGIHLSGSMIITGFVTQFYNFIIAIYVTNQIMGNYRLAVNFAILVSVFVTPVQTLLFPAFAKIDCKNEPDNLKKIYQYSVKYASLLIVPATFMIMALSQPAVSTLFPGKYELTPIFLTLYIAINIYTVFGHLSSENLIKGQGRTDVNLKLTIMTASLGLILSLILIPNFGVIGLILTNLFSIVPQIIISLWWIKKQYKATINLKSSTKILTASITSTLITYAFVYFVHLPNWIKLAIGTIIYISSYLIIAPLIRAIDQNDVKTLREMTKSLGPITPILNIPLTIIEKLSKK